MKSFFVDIYRSCRDHDLLNLSANISFFAIVSLLPLAMIFVAVLGHVLGTGEIVAKIADAFTDMIPGAGEIFLSNIQNLIKGRSSHGVFGLIFLLLISTVLFTSLERAFDKIFGSEKKRHFIYSQLLSILVICIILVFLFLPSAINLLESFLSRYGYSVPLESYLSGKTFYIIFTIISFVVTISIVPNHRVFVRYALVGGIIFAAGIAVARYIFQWYLVMTFDRYNLIYGSLNALILTVSWIYYLSNILLLSAEVVACLQKRSKR